MTQYEEGVQDAPLARDPHGPQQQQHGYPQGAPQMGPAPYGYGMGWQMRPRRVYPIETKPFFLTSEFVAAVLAVAGIAITAASSEA